MAVVGCGGTGGFVAEGLCRLLPKKTDILLIDFDRVEEHNLGRQHFYPGDLGKFKSEALAERLARNFEREIAYSVFPFNPMMGEDWGDGMRSLEISDALVIGCVDNAMARRAIAGDMPGMLGWWIDAGNGYHSRRVPRRRALCGSATGSGQGTSLGTASDRDRIRPSGSHTT